ncbi:2-succinyl-6-hydroxy-2,4-cyclohexadiene-1-carboxylate synthase [Sutcliffiella rhizosphaerae]|uniref:Putative 2-succinyl-6-hydroxy-2,4-cyclohexadiene-1-carboxylate synthase n=1 Tax=Sutcliffiella rhizosphaerae TaxID=2880967 RepID=A0ABM8YR07_9BACI|nr:2-succinyl-6-hydroxy-2,4-cyclohexadiene-1-carboxylate synthase [Sutcliffiella rhizosphaerae]CAG9622400.1 2-succinyl-6-hydroxy-2, 4-cyclohexadiene-1-carboxylate synthase [Sutcliffiella rhizosphaerae]
MEVNGMHYHVEVLGSGPISVLLLHGFTGCGENYKDLLEDFPQKDMYTFILLDQLGHGKTNVPMDPDRYSMNQTINDLYTIVKKLEITKLSLYGYSMGGRVALAFATTYPDLVNKLVLESASPGLKEEAEQMTRKQADEKLAKRILEKGVPKFVDYWTDIPLFQSQKKLPDNIQKKIYHQRLNNSPLGLANSLRGIGTGAQPNYWEALSQLPIPVLLAAGEWDEKFVHIAEEMKNLIRESYFVKIKDAGHAIHVEQPRKFGKIVSEFLAN